MTATPTLLVRGGDVLDGDGRRRADVLVVDGVVAAVAEGIDAPPGSVVLDAGACVVAPGLVDLHAHLRQPGREEAETVETGTRAGALGGYTAVVAMPNTEPAIDNAGTAREVLALGRGALAEVAVAGAITVGRAGERLAPMGELSDLGVVLFTDDGSGVQDGALMRRALDYARSLGVTLAQHCEDEALAAGGSMHEGAWSSRLGIPGIPAAAEEAMVARDVALCRLTGAPVHFLHLSSAGSVALVRAAKAQGLAVTAEVAPHHLFLTDAETAGYDPVFKVNPPLRTPSDVEALWGGLGDGTIDAVATDHAPHAPETKDRPFAEAPPGMLGLETALAVVLTALRDGRAEAEEVDRGLARALAWCSWRPAAIARLAAHGGPVRAGRPANLCVVDPAATWTVEPARLASRSTNTPYAGRTLTGRVRHTVSAGEPVVIDAEAQR
ncbi:MAG TPA: dihydroorotase [Acidimicrobiales bacterium]|nr:dihydroorotase [Acidimicrobiales bacterium]